jgi:hypothetical protein
LIKKEIKQKPFTALKNKFNTSASPDHTSLPVGRQGNNKWFLKIKFYLRINDHRLKSGAYVCLQTVINKTKPTHTMNYNNKSFKPISNSENGETSDETVFHYQQRGNIVTAAYLGGKIKQGHLIGLVDEQGNIDMRYHQVNDKDELMTGDCKSTPEILENGKIRLHETWEWTSGDKSKGKSIIEEM